MFAQQLRAARVEAAGEIIFIDQRFEVFQRSVAFSPCKGRRQMVDDDGGCAPLGLRSLARIVDDEGVNVGQRAQRRFGVTALRERQRLARQPFEIAVLAIVQHPLRAKHFAQPDIEGEIAVRGNKRRVVISLFGLDIVAARRLHRDRHIPVNLYGQMECVPFHERVILRRAPALFHFAAHACRELFVMLAILLQGELRARCRAHFIPRVGRAFEQRMNKRRAVLRETA